MSVYSQLLRCIELDEMDNSLSPYIDEVLEISGELNTDNISEELKKICQSIGIDQVKARVERYISKTYLEIGENSGDKLFIGLDEARAKERYRKIIRIFHPDRGINDQLWLNRRSEKVNNAYRRFKANKLQFDNVASHSTISKKSHFVAKTSINKPRAAKAGIIKRNGFFRKYAGQQQSLQSLVFKWILIAFGLLILLALLASIDYGIKPNAIKANKQTPLKQKSERLGRTGESKNTFNLEKNIIDVSSETESKIKSEPDSLPLKILKPSREKPSIKSSANVLSKPAFNKSAEIKSTQTLWVYKKYLDINESKRSAVVIGNGVRLRSSPAYLMDNIQGSVKAGDNLQLLNTVGDWCEVILLSSSTDVQRLSNKRVNSDSAVAFPYAASHIAPQTPLLDVNLLDKQKYLALLSKNQQKLPVLERKLEPQHIEKKYISVGEIDHHNFTSNAIPTIENAQVKALLAQFRRSFALGDISALGSLYLNSANEAGAKGRAAIIKRYKQLFAITDRRNMKIKSPEINVSQAIAMVKVGIEANVWYEPEKAGTMILAEIMLFNTPSGLRIASFETY